MNQIEKARASMRMGVLIQPVWLWFGQHRGQHANKVGGIAGTKRNVPAGFVSPDAGQSSRKGLSQ